jgi:hypothetical protein
MSGEEIRLRADFGPLQVQWDNVLQTWSLDAPYNADGLQSWNNWNGDSKASIPGLPVLSPYLWTMTTIDLGGLELKKETFFPVGSTIQDPGLYINTSDLTAGMTVVDVISDKLLDTSSLIDFVYFYSNNNSMYGMIRDDNDASTIVMGQYRFMTGNSNFTYGTMMRTEVQTSFSSGEPTAASKLYCYRIIVPFVGSTNTDVRIPASRFYLTGVRDKEEDLVYMMRLKRSYELDQSQS